MRIAEPSVQLSQKLNNTTVVKKGLVDVITNGKSTFLVATQSASKRCGGQGDVLGGIIGTFLNYQYRVENENHELLPVVLACMTLREAARVAFNEKGHSLVTPDIIEIGLSGQNGVISQVYKEMIKDGDISKM